MSDPIKVLIVDDSAIIRSAFSKELEKHPSIHVVGTAPDPFVAKDKIKELNPQVIILDIEMPRMNGLKFLTKLMAQRPIPTIIVSSLTQRGCNLALQCLECGAVDALPKPDAHTSLAELGTELAKRIVIAAGARMPTATTAPLGTKKAPCTLSGEGIRTNKNQLILIGTSTGGPEALRNVLEPLPAGLPPIAIVQHMPAGFISSLAARLDGLSQVNVSAVEDQDPLLPGTALIGSGEEHFKLQRIAPGHGYRAVKSPGPKVCGHRPSVEVLFESGARLKDAEVLAILMTGMGKDGAGGLLTLHEKGAYTVCQDEHSCVVYGMPREAVQRGAADEVVPLDKIPERIVAFAKGELKRSARLS